MAMVSDYQEETMGRLRSFSFFQGLDEPTLSEISRLAQKRSYARGEIISLEGERCTTAYFIIEGQVKVNKVSLEGREQVMVRLGPGDAFCLVPVFDGGPNPATVEAFTEVLLFAFRKGDFLRLVRRYPEVALAVLEHLSAKLRHFVALVEDLSLYTVEARLSRLLLRLSTGEDVVHRCVTQQEMAAELGTVREVIGRALRDLEREGIIHFDRHRIVIVDRAALEAKAMV
ncbi:MAG TPA: Crp/Fnr family transcriptional regulator [Anaerolineae bacterium]|nr:Crp/Fnr family transcriptional regulator [Anaerolineae bacterium]